VSRGKTKACLEKMPGGHCDKATGAPDCTYSYEDAGEVHLDELTGIDDYDEFWEGSFTKCARDKAQGKLSSDHVCLHQKEFDLETDKGVGCSFWDGKKDIDKCTERMDKVRKLFKKNDPGNPESLTEPACEFDMYYDGEFKWEVNHTGGPDPNDWWANKMSPDDM